MWLQCFEESFYFCLLTGNELLYRSRDGDVIKFNVDTDEKTILVHNKKFVSIFSYILKITEVENWPGLAKN